MINITIYLEVIGSLTSTSNSNLLSEIRNVALRLALLFIRQIAHVLGLIHKHLSTHLERICDFGGALILGCTHRWNFSLLIHHGLIVLLRIELTEVSSLILWALRHHRLWRLILIHLLLILLLLLHLHQLLVHIENRVHLLLYLTLIASANQIWLCLLHARRCLMELTALERRSKLRLIRVLADHIAISL